MFSHVYEADCVNGPPAGSGGPPGAAGRRSVAGRRGVILTRLGVSLTLSEIRCNHCAATVMSGFGADSVNTFRINVLTF